LRDNVRSNVRDSVCGNVRRHKQRQKRLSLTSASRARSVALAKVGVWVNTRVEVSRLKSQCSRGISVVPFSLVPKKNIRLNRCIHIVGVGTNGKQIDPSVGADFHGNASHFRERIAMVFFHQQFFLDSALCPQLISKLL
jgi:hypothetical protein